VRRLRQWHGKALTSQDDETSSALRHAIVCNLKHVPIDEVPLSMEVTQKVIEDRFPSLNEPGDILDHHDLGLDLGHEASHLVDQFVAWVRSMQFRCQAGEALTRGTPRENIYALRDGVGK
jgi:hypothetical protein